MDGGVSYQAFAKGLPAVAIHDIKIQKRENHLLLGTHGRSIYRADITPIQSMEKGKSVQLFEVASIRKSPRWGNSFSMWRDPMEPEVKVPYFMDYAGKFSLVVKDASGKELQRMPLLPQAGLGVATYDLTITEKGKNALEKSNGELNIQKAKNGNYYLPKGTYTLALDGGGGNTQAATTTLEVK